jgi:oligopeptidase B
MYADPEVRRYIMAYSPYENVKKQRYPAVMVTSSYEDTRVAYWGPAKWVARLRELAVEGSGEILLLTSFHAGHFGEGGRLGRARQISRECAWLHRVMGLPG